MISVPKLFKFKQLEKLVIDNSPVILTAIGVVGSVTTAYLTGKATFKAAEVLSTEVYTASEEFNETITTQAKMRAIWKLYIPAVGSGATTIAAIICANRISTKRAAALALAYSLNEKRFDEYKDKMQEKLGVNKEQKARDEIAQERLNKNPIESRQVIVTGNGDVMFYDKPSDRYFKSNVEKIRKAENDINQEVIHDNLPVTVADFYRYIGIKPTSASYETGWTYESLLDVDFSTCLSTDNEPCVVIDYDSIPIRGAKSRPACEDD